MNAALKVKSFKYTALQGQDILYQYSHEFSEKSLDKTEIHLMRERIETATFQMNIPAFSDSC
jgi:hypothetical protein